MRRRVLPRVRLSCLVLLLFGAWLGVVRAEDHFIANIADLPLMPGLQEVVDAGLVFDKPGGRIVEAYAVGDLQSAQVAAFYERTLPQLGWQTVSDMQFQREGEVLRIDISRDDTALTVKFSIAPK